MNRGSLLITILAVSLMAGCPQRQLKPVTPCNTAGVVEKVKVNQVNNVDLLFVVDDSNSMSDKQVLLASQLPKLVRALTSGRKNPDDTTADPDFPPVKNLRVGVVTTDLGDNGLTTVPSLVSGDPLCNTKPRPTATEIAPGPPRKVYTTGDGANTVYLGDDGVMINWASGIQSTGASPVFTPIASQGPCPPNSSTCTLTFVNELAGKTCGDSAALEPDKRFLEFDSTKSQYANNPTLLSQDTQNFAGKFACRARVGNVGCNFEQPLEAMLKALYPYKGSDFNFIANTLSHGGTTAPPTLTDEPLNGSFVRQTSDSLLAVVVVTDEDDCSSSAPDLFIQHVNANGVSDQNYLCMEAADKQEKDPKAQVALHPVDRYINGLLAIKADPASMVFAAITGLPEGSEQRFYQNTDTVDYSGILAAESMQYAAYTPTASDSDTVRNIGIRPMPACQGTAGAETVRADPSRRVVRVAQGLQAKEVNTTVQSICQEDFGPAIDAIIRLIGNALGGVCLPKPINRNSDGTVPCDVFETLPAPGSIADTSLATKCSDLPGRTYLRTDNGQEVCRVAQVSATDSDRQSGKPLAACNRDTGSSCGWYYDDFTDPSQTADSVKKSCGATSDGSRRGSQRIAFTDGSKANSARVRFECLEQTQSIPADGPGAGIGKPCSTTDATMACASNLTCDATSATCQLKCENTAGCPQGYVCDTKGTGYCLNPVCGN